MQALPRQLFISSDDMKPSKHRHWNVPGVLLHWPPSQASGLSSHSSMSGEQWQRGRKVNQQWNGSRGCAGDRRNPTVSYCSWKWFHRGQTILLQGLFFFPIQAGMVLCILVFFQLFSHGIKRMLSRAIMKQFFSGYTQLTLPLVKTISRIEVVNMMCRLGLWGAF